MNREILGFIIWVAAGCFISAIGIRGFFKKEAMGFWANAKTIPVKNIKLYNRAVGKLFLLYGIFFIILGIPLLIGSNSALILLSCIGVMIETILLMVIYTLKIEKKYRK